jgi:hypothetical protein
MVCGEEFLTALRYSRNFAIVSFMARYGSPERNPEPV